MSVARCTILDMETWYKDTHLCTICDALIEVTRKDDFRNIWHCGGECNLLSVEDATIHPTNERNKMETNYSHPADVEGSAVPHSYDANVLVTYKDITDGVATYPTIKVNDLEYKLDNIKYLYRRIEKQEKQIGQVIDNLTVEGWYNPNVDKEEILRELCEIFEHEAKQEIVIRATVTVDVRYNCPIADVEDFDGKYFLQDELTIDAYNGDIVIESWDVEDADVDY